MEGRAIVFHPSCITYDTKKVFSWEQYNKRRKWNNGVKAFRKAIGYKEPTLEEITLNVMEKRPDLFKDDNLFGESGDFGRGKTTII